MPQQHVHGLCSVISRCHPAIVGRRISSGVVIPPSLHANRTRADENSHASAPATTPSSPPTPALETDPWSTTFDDATSDLSPIPLRNHRLPSRFFTSRPGPTTFFSSNSPRQPGKRWYGTDANLQREDRDSTWDHIFEGIEDVSLTEKKHLGLPGPSADRRPRGRKTMTAREISAFDDMFDMIFTAVNKQAQTQDAPPESSSSAVNQASPAGNVAPASELAPAPAQETPPTIGRIPSGEMTDFFGKLRRHSNLMRRTSEDDELLDRKKEQMLFCKTDQELLVWAAREVFHESEIPSPSGTPSAELARYLADPTYPHIIAHLMNIFRTKYRAPHTALALFAHAKRRSIHSYVFGCTTPVYNERLDALWQIEGCDGLDTLEATLAEMRANGVQPDTRTRALVEQVRREVGAFVLGREDDTTSDMWSTMERVVALVQRKSERKPRKGKLGAKQEHWNEGWKSAEDPRLGEDRLTLQS